MLNLIQGLHILCKYDKNAVIESDCDRILVGVNPDDVRGNDKEELSLIGWCFEDNTYYFNTGMP